MKSATPPTIVESYSANKWTVIVIKSVKPAPGWSRKATSAYAKALEHGFRLYPGD